MLLPRMTVRGEKNVTNFEELLEYFGGQSSNWHKIQAYAYIKPVATVDFQEII
ncbi:MAG TPA: hypothetical protein V6C95_06085 [Coleofasciculaceae cyanobacterium]